MVAGTSCRHAGKVLRDAGNFLYGYSTGAVKLAGMPASCRHLNRERIALERFLLAGMRWISKFAGSGFAGKPVTTLPTHHYTTMDGASIIMHITCTSV